MRRLLFCLILLGFCLPVSAQDGGCGTVFTPDQLRQLRAFQARLHGPGAFSQKAGVTYVPIQFHIVGNSKGVGYYSITNLLNTLCELNVRFEPTGFYFYLYGPVNYINDDDLYAGNPDAVWSVAEQNKEFQAVNVFFHGSGAQYCGVYYGGSDVVLVKNGCQGPGATTLTHELGHFFGLPHTFLGWENGNTDFNPERVDGSNCRTSGDGFCDTRPDYVSVRWACPYPFFLKDPANILFKPDSSFYMSYSSDICQSRFSNEQMEEMRSNLGNRGISTPTLDVRVLPAPTKVKPLEGDSNLNPESVKLVWNKVEGAYAYHVQAARYGWWEFLNFDQLVFDTAVVAKLFGNWPYAWRVRALSKGNTCSEFGRVDSFTTKEVPLGVRNIIAQNGFMELKNPFYVGEFLEVQSDLGTEIMLLDLTGKYVLQEVSKSTVSVRTELRTPGMYFLILQQGDSRISRKILVVPAH